jgi:hypothetical protein
VPVLDSIPMWIDHRVMMAPFNAEKTLTKDTVLVELDAVPFWVFGTPRRQPGEGNW